MWWIHGDVQSTSACLEVGLRESCLASDRRECLRLLITRYSPICTITSIDRHDTITHQPKHLHEPSEMPPKRQLPGTSVGRPQQANGYARNLINELTSAENRTVVTSVVFFAVSDALLGTGDS